MNDYETTIFEKNPVPGGLAACWKRKDYLIDGGIHFLTGYKPGISLYNVFKEVGAHKAECVEIKTYARYIDEKSGRMIDISADLDKFQTDMAGQWSMSMGGVQLVIYSGKHVIQLLCHDEEKEFNFVSE